PTTNSEPFFITAGPAGAGGVSGVLSNKIGRAPACGLGFSPRLANNTLPVNYNLGIDTPAGFMIHFFHASGPVNHPITQQIPAVVPPQTFSLSKSNFPNEGNVTVVSELAMGPGQPLCAEWTAVNTAQ